MDTLTLIQSRRSVRKFKRANIPAKTIEEILEAGRWAPSGLNNQPWRFIILEKAKKNALAKFTHYGSIIANADKVILIFLDKKASYNYEKDLMAIGACIENMLLYIHSQKLGACWLGEILSQRNHLQNFLKLSGHLQLEAVVALGYPLTVSKKARRRPLKSLLIHSG